MLYRININKKIKQQTQNRYNKRNVNCKISDYKENNMTIKDQLNEIKDLLISCIKKSNKRFVSVDNRMNKL